MSKAKYGPAVKTYVYGITDGEFIKYGVSRLPHKRMADLQVANPRPLSLLLAVPCKHREQAFKVEAYLHRLCSSHFVQGEWYRRASYDMLLSIHKKYLSQGGQLPEAIIKHRAWKAQQPVSRP